MQLQTVVVLTAFCNRAGVSPAGVWGVPFWQAVCFSAWPAPVYPLFMYTLKETRFSVVSVIVQGFPLLGFGAASLLRFFASFWNGPSFARSNASWFFVPTPDIPP